MATQIIHHLTLDKIVADCDSQYGVVAEKDEVVKFLGWYVAVHDRIPSDKKQYLAAKPLRQHYPFAELVKATFILSVYLIKLHDYFGTMPISAISDRLLSEIRARVAEDPMIERVLKQLNDMQTRYDVGNKNPTSDEVVSRIEQYLVERFGRPQSPRQVSEYRSPLHKS